MTDERDDLLREIGETLQVEPSAGFRAGVRMRVGREGVTRRKLWIGIGLAGAVVAFVMLLAVPTNRQESGEDRARLALAPAIAPATVTAPPLAVAPVAVVAEHVGPRPNSTRTTRGGESRFDVQIQAEQRVLLHELTIAIQDGRVQLLPADTSFNDAVSVTALVPPESIAFPVIQIEALPAGS